MSLTFQILSPIIRALTYVIIPAVFIPLIYIIVIDNIVNRILSRIYNANFSLKPEKLLNLFIGYFIGSLIISYTIKELFAFKFPDNSQISIATVALSALAFCFTSRIISKQRGYLIGKQFHSVLSSAAVLIFLVNIFIGINERYMNVSELDIQTNITLYVTYFYESFIFNIGENLKYFAGILDYLFIGSVVTAFFGEIIIMNLKPYYRSIPIALEKFHSDFELVSTDELNRKMISMTNDIENIKSLKIITRTLTSFETLHYNLLQHTNKSNQKNLLGIKIIAPEYSNPAEELEIRPLTVLTKLISRKNFNDYKQLKVQKYKKRLENLSIMEKEGKVEWIKKDFQNFRMIVVNDNRVLLIINSGDFTKSKVGIYSKEPYIVNICISIFNNEFDTPNITKSPNITENPNITEVS